MGHRENVWDWVKERIRSIEFEIAWKDAFLLPLIVILSSYLWDRKVNKFNRHRKENQERTV